MAVVVPLISLVGTLMPKRWLKLDVSVLHFVQLRTGELECRSYRLAVPSLYGIQVRMDQYGSLGGDNSTSLLLNLQHISPKWRKPQEIVSIIPM